MDFDYKAARNAGYSDDQILDGLAKNGDLDFDLPAARKAGFSSSDILKSLIGDRAREPEPAAPESSSLLRRAGDVGISALKGVIGVPEALVGLADIPTGGAAGRAAESAGVKFKQSKELLSDLYSPEQKAANQKVAEADGFVGTAGAMLSNPSTIAQTAIESIPQMGLGGAIGRGVLAAAPKIGALGAAAIGEGAVGGGTAAEQIRQQSGGDLSLGQAGAALASGVGTGVFGLVGGRLAQKLGVADIDTALVQAGAPAGSTKGVIRRMLEGGISEGVFEEVPQSIQEQIWQNAAMDKPLLEGVPEAAAQGLLVGGLFGGVAGGALHGKADAPAATDPQTGQPLLLGNTPDPFISFPDGSVGRKSEFDAFLNGLPEDQRAAARARFMGYEAQPVTPADVLQAESVDQAIEVAQRAVAEGSPEFQAQRGAEIDAAWSTYMRERAAQMQTELTAAEQQRRDADVPAMQAQLADQQVAQAEALTRAQGFDDAAPPTAIQSAMQAAQGKRQQMIEAARLRQRAGESDAAWRTRTAEISADRQGQFDQASAARDRQDSVMAQIQATQQQTDLANSISADLGTPAVQPTAMQLAMQEAAAKRRATTTPGAADVPPIPVDAAAPADAGPAGNPAGAAALAPAVDTPIPAADSVATAGRGTETAAADVEQARAILTAAGVTGNDRMAALRSIRTGENTLDDLIDAHPPKEAANADAPRAAGTGIRNDGLPRNEVAAPVQRGSKASAEGAARLDNGGAGSTAIDARSAGENLADAAAPAAPAELSDAAPAARAITGRQIDSEWNEFTPESGTLNIDRDQMPQVKAEHRGALVNFLAARGVTHESATEMPASDLKPTQREFSREKVAKAAGFQGGDRSILVSSDNHVLDGHHQWMAKMEAGEPVKVIRLNAPIRELLDQVHDFPSSQVSDGASPQVMDEETYLATNGASRQGFGDAALHRSSSNVSESSRKAAIERQSRSDTELNARREELRAEYRSKVESGELRAPTLGEETERTAQGDPDSEATQAAKRLIEKRARRQAERDASAENPKLGQSAEDGLSGQEPLFSRAAPTDSAAFKRWFGDSKVVDADGNPQIVYHGTTNGDIEQFEAGWSSSTEASGRNFYFSNSAANASSYAERGRAPKNGGRAVYPVYLAMSNPLIMDLAKTGSTWAQVDFNEENPMPQRLKEAIGKAKYMIPEQWHVFDKWYTLSLDEIATYAQKAGYDGVIAKNVSDGGSKKTMARQTTYIAFEPTQIKSATGNSGNFDPANADLRASTGAEPARGMPAAEVTRAIARLRAKWAGFAKVNVVQSVDELPAALRDAAGDDSLTEGLYDPRTSTAYLIADNLASAERAAWVAAHEVVGHGGLRMLNDQTVRQAMKMAGANRFIQQLGAAIQQDRGAGTNEVTALEEAVAELSAATETGDFAGLEARYGVTVPAAARPGIRGVVARVVAAVRQFLATVAGIPASEVSDSDVFALIGQQQAAVEGRSQAPRRSSAEPARASVIRPNERTIEVDGQRRPITDSTGKQIGRGDFAAQRRFYEWFGDSAVVDKNGRPLVVYHGTTADFDKFAPASHFGTEKQANAILGYTQRQREGGQAVVPTYLAIENPKRLDDDTGVDWPAEVAKAKAEGHDGIVYTNWGEFDPDADGNPRDSWIAFSPSQVKSATGNSGAFDRNEESILASRAPAAGTERIPKWAESLTDEQKNALRKSGAIYSEKTMRQKIDELREGALKKMQYGIFDQFAPIKDQLGRVPYIMARMAKAADGTLEAMMLYGRPHLDADGGMLVDTTKKGFIETMQALNGEHDQFFSWLAGKRAAQLKKEGRENLFTDTDISSLATLNQGQMKDGTSREAAYLRAQKDVAELNKSVLDIAEASGLIDAESRRVWASDFYVPFFRVMEEGITGPSIKSGLVNQKSVKKLKGGTNNLNDLTKNMLMNWSTLLTASAKNRAAKASLDVAAGMGVASEAPESTIKAMAKSAKTRAVSYMEGGTNRWFVVEDEHLLAAISALEFNGYNNDAMRAMSWFKNALTRAITVSPFFKVRNLIRDSLSVLAVSDINRNPLINLKNGYSLMRDDSVRAQMVAGGGIYRFGMTMEGNRAENVKRMIDDGVADDTILNTAGKMAKFTRKLWGAYEEVGDLSENLNRAALYQKLRDEGKTHLEASFEARDLMDFGLSGAWAGVRALNQILPFFNARLQGIYKLGRGYNDDPKRMGYVIGSLALATIALSAAYKDDDDWKKRSDSDRNNYWWFKVGSTAYRIPKPFEIGAAATAIDHFAALFYDSENTNAERFQHQVGELINGQLAMNPIPQVFRPLIDVYSNKDAFSGRPIESQAMQRLRPEDRYSSNTSELARLLSKSGALVDPVSLVAGTGVKQLSPVQIDSLIKGYFAGVGVLAVAGVDGLLHHTLIDRGAALPVPVRAMTGSFVEDLPTSSSRYVDMLYKTAQDVEQTHASYQNAIKQGDIEKAREIMREEGGTLAKYHMVESLKKNESRINLVIQRVRDDKLLTGEQKDEQIRRLKIVQDRIARQMVTGR